MKTLKRDEFKNDEVFNFFYQQILRNHIVANHTTETLIENKDIKDFCETAVHFSIIELEKHLTAHISYEVNSWYTQGGARVSIQEITMYDDFDEYEMTRKMALMKSDKADIPNFDLN